MALRRSYGYIINKRKEFEIVPTEADIVRRIFDLYNNAGWGYKKIANHLTDEGIPTPRMSEQMRKEAQGEAYNRKTKAICALNCRRAMDFAVKMRETPFLDKSRKCHYTSGI